MTREQLRALVTAAMIGEGELRRIAVAHAGDPAAGAAAARRLVETVVRQADFVIDVAASVPLSTGQKDGPDG
jgi:hypothetical protein